MYVNVLGSSLLIADLCEMPQVRDMFHHKEETESQMEGTDKSESYSTPYKTWYDLPDPQIDLEL